MLIAAAIRLKTGRSPPSRFPADAPMKCTSQPGCPVFLRTARRSFLRLGVLGGLGLSLPDLLRQAARARSLPTKARRAVLVFLTGGPSHHDTFDPKPDAPAEIRGDFSAIST